MRAYPTATHYSEHFSRRELDCRCGCTTPAGIEMNLTALAGHLETLRDLVAVPLTVLSGYRCPRHNEAVGGASLSQHVHGLAADISSRTLSPARLRSQAERVPQFRMGGIGTYRTWLHVDIRRNGPARWQG